MLPGNFSYFDFCRFQNVPRETFSRLENFTELLIKWQKTINLIADSTIGDVWQRHIFDSAQMIACFPQANVAVADIGSGAGFPGLILAILGISPVTLIESDKRKVAFLQEAARVTQSNINIINQRAEATNYGDFAVITARGFAPIIQMINILSATLTSSHKLLLMKGKSYISELEEAQKYYSFETELFPSLTDKEAKILSLTRIHKKGAFI